MVNPEHLKNQIEGSVVMAIGGALFEAVEFANGRILNPRLAKYRVPRFSDLPVMETVLVDRKDLPSAGAGETPIVGLAPAVGNAIFRATGTRIRSLPMAPKGFDTHSCRRLRLDNRRHDSGAHRAAAARAGDVQAIGSRTGRETGIAR